MVRSAAALCAVVILSGFAAGRQQATHTVVDGDTLWDLAQRYYGNPFDWRRIWEANRAEVADPNLIVPGQVLAIPGREAAVTEVSVEAPAPEPAQAPAPPPARALRDEPTVFRQDTSVMRAGVVRSAEIQYLSVPRDLVYSAPWVVGPGQIPEHLGVVEEFAGGASLSRTPRSFDRVRLSFTGPAFPVGIQLRAYRMTKSIEGVGEVVTPTGVITVAEVDGNGAVGIVAKEYARMSLGDLVGPLPPYRLVAGQYAQDVSGGTEAMVMGFAGSAELQDIGSVVFLDQGADDGVAIGDEFVYRNPAAGADVVEGRLQVVGVTPAMAAARVLSMDDVVFRRGVVVRLVRKMR